MRPYLGSIALNSGWFVFDKVDGTFGVWGSLLPPLWVCGTVCACRCQLYTLWLPMLWCWFGSFTPYLNIGKEIIKGSSTIIKCIPSVRLLLASQVLLLMSYPLAFLYVLLLIDLHDSCKFSHILFPVNKLFSPTVP